MPFSTPAFLGFVELFQEILQNTRNLPQAAALLLKKLDSLENGDPFFHAMQILHLRAWVEAKAKGQKFGSMIPRVETKKSPIQFM